MIQVEDLTRSFPLPGGRELLAVDQVSFSVAAGEVYGLLGPNGAGKTTTLRMLLGLLRPTRGRAMIAGYRTTEFGDEVKRRVGLVSANAGVYQRLTAREMLLYFADLYGVPPDEARREMLRLADLFGFTEFLNQPCGTLSTGQRQRINLARALIHGPPVLLLDEPTLGLDLWGSQVISEFVTHVRQEGKAVILCTHHLDEAERTCTRFGLMQRGRIVREGTLSELQAATGGNSLVEIFLKLSLNEPEALLRSPA